MQTVDPTAAYTVIELISLAPFSKVIDPPGRDGNCAFNLASTMFKLLTGSDMPCAVLRTRVTDHLASHGGSERDIGDAALNETAVSPHVLSAIFEILGEKTYRRIR